ncbi:HNH endonuclease [Bordetella genomosp. 4]|uniref:HNH nuclease domain-containing protein n=1 Tax=Bordetella genomosp. 4 TaxID=463044 RepID=A0A261U598_9BORD|nr:HNH endonuclease signature motif containing protein [Bordetella genomosp. 4]OZI56751.1 hypothetical protein CAL20_15235 [Bordetella genomosp. 4]
MTEQEPHDRLRGRRLQQARLRIWAHDPRCARCRNLTEYPSGFELDHIAPVHKGGGNEDENLQVLCHACHEVKTAEDLGRRYRCRIGLDGWPLDSGENPGGGGSKVERWGPENRAGGFLFINVDKKAENDSAKS